MIYNFIIRCTYGSDKAINTWLKPIWMRDRCFLPCLPTVCDPIFSKSKRLFNSEHRLSLMVFLGWQLFKFMHITFLSSFFIQPNCFDYEYVALCASNCVYYSKCCHIWSSLLHVFCSLSKSEYLTTFWSNWQRRKSCAFSLLLSSKKNPFRFCFQVFI